MLSQFTLSDSVGSIRSIGKILAISISCSFITLATDGCAGRLNMPFRFHPAITAKSTHTQFFFQQFRHSFIRTGTWFPAPTSRLATMFSTTRSAADGDSTTPLRTATAATCYAHTTADVATFWSARARHCDGIVKLLTTVAADIGSQVLFKLRGVW